MDWGLGHATRCVPLIKELSKHNSIILGVTAITRPVFDEEFPLLNKIELPSYNIRYSSLLNVSVKLLMDWPRISGVIKKENKLLDKIIDEHKIDVIISDSRYGLYSEKVHCILITHQIFLKTPFANSFAQKKNKLFLARFHEIWIPDYENELQSLSGELSHGKHFHSSIKYIGPQSRLKKAEPEAEFDYLLLLSGPPPLLGKLTKQLLEKVKQFPDKKFVLVSPEKQTLSFANLQSFQSPPKKKLSELICSAKTIICRSGYSTLMDLHLLDKKEMIFIPTPGQSEQEYLAKYWEGKFNAKIYLEKEINQVQL